MSPDALRGLSQNDSDAGTVGDQARCSCNSTVAALAMRGNQALSTGLTRAAADVAQQIARTTDPTRLAELGTVHGQLMGLAVRAGTNNLQRNDLNTAADALYRAYDTNRSDRIMYNGDVARLNQAVGLLPQGAATDGSATQEVRGRAMGTVDLSTGGPNRGQAVGGTVDVNSPAYRQARDRVAADTWNRLQPGDTAMVGVFNGANGPDRPNHFISVGRNAQGQPYLYDPANSPNYMTGRAAEDHLRGHVGISLQNPRLDRARGAETYDVHPAVTFLPQRREVASQ
jgi:hypothetical protein